MKSVYIVEDEAAVRDIWVAVVENYVAGAEVVGFSEDGAEAVAECFALRPDLVILDIWMPGINGLEVQARLREGLPGARVLVVTGFASADIMRSAIARGARGFVTKPTPPKTLVAAVETVLRGERFFSPAVAEVLGDEVDLAPAPAGRAP